MGDEHISKADQKVAQDAISTTPADADLEVLAAQSPDPVKDTHDVIEDRFFWAFYETEARLNELQAAIDAKDEPPWSEHLAEIALDVALMAGGAAVGEFIANKLIGEEGLSVLHEFTKATFEEGIGTAVAVGRAAFVHAKPSHRFIAGQIEAARSYARTRQDAWTMRGRHLVTTPQQASAVRAAFSQPNMNLAGDKQYAASRDAWVSYTAQTKYGSNEHGTEGGTTNMMSEQRRESTNRSAPGFVPAQAPDVGAAILGRAPGVLEVIARLPELDEHGTERKQPEVVVAFLNGMSSEIRDQYAHAPIEGLAIPRQVTCVVEGGMPNFRLDVDEAGTIGYIPAAQSAWLRARAKANTSDQEDVLEAAHDLLGELRADEIREKGI